ncbi:MAG: hypothetical protein JNL56_07200 [Alphaproteobacteria bacterium]|nr:hypothetical protein [Alphaproteobacteria bacterium]
MAVHCGGFGRAVRMGLWAGLVAAALGGAAGAQDAVPGPDTSDGFVCEGPCLAPRDVCLKAVETWAPRVASLEEIIPGQKRELEAWFAAVQREKEARGWLGPLIDAVLGIPDTFYPPRVLAEVNQNMGEKACFDEVLAECRAEIGRVEAQAGSAPAPADTSKADYRAAFDAFAARLAAPYKARGDEHWEIAQKLKAMFAASPYEYRLATEANWEVGYSTACRETAEGLNAMRFGDAAEGGVFPPPADEYCRELLKEQPYFCTIPPMCTDCDLEAYQRDADRCCKVEVTK